MRLRLSPQSNKQIDFGRLIKSFASMRLRLSPQSNHDSLRRLVRSGEVASMRLRLSPQSNGRPGRAGAAHAPGFNEAAAFAAEQQPLCNSFGRKACNQGLRALWRHVPVQHRTRETVVLCTQVIVGLLRK